MKLLKIFAVCSFFSALRAHAMSFNAGAAAGYEVLSYKESVQELTGGSAAGDTYEQTSFTGLSFGVGGQLGLLRLGALEPLAGLDIMHSQLKKAVDGDGYKTEGAFNFTHATVSVGARYWLDDSLSLSALAGMSQAVSNSMTVQRTSTSNQESLEETSFEISGHKKNELILIGALNPTNSPLMFMLGFRIGPGCFDCKAKSSEAKSRTYLTRSGGLSVAWLIDNDSDDDLERSDEDIHQTRNIQRQVRQLCDRRAGQCPFFGTRRKVCFRPWSRYARPERFV
jgi:hypothetical protein